MLAALSYTQQKGENKCDKQANVHKFPDMCAYTCTQVLHVHGHVHCGGAFQTPTHYGTLVHCVLHAGLILLCQTTPSTVFKIILV